MASRDFNTTNFGSRPEGRSRGKKMTIERPRKVVMTTEERISLALMKKTTFLPTRFLDEELLREMGILDEVLVILTKIGLENFCQIKTPTYPDLAREFFATVEVVYASKRNPDPNLGKVTFKVNNKLYEISIADFCGVYGLEHNSYAKFKPFANVQDFWTIIASGKATGSPKMTLIRYPPLRIVAKFLANTIFARKECGTMKAGEFAILFKGVFHRLGTVDGNLIPYSIGLDVNLGCIFAKSMTTIRKMKTKEPVCYMGGLVTPLLEYVGIDLTAFATLERMDSIDKQYLMRCDTLVKTSEAEYRFRYWDRNAQPYEITLPYPERTAFTAVNLRFEYWDTRLLAEDAVGRARREPELNQETWELPRLRMKKNTPQKRFLVTAYQIQDRVNRLAKKQTSFLTKQFKKLKEKLKRIAGDQYGDSSEEEMPEWNTAEEESYMQGQRYEDDDDEEPENDDFEDDFDEDEEGGTSTP